jgi:glycine dehydrogenase subunit 1
VFLSCLGKEGVREVGKINVQKGHYAHEMICGTTGFEPRFTAPFFNEFVIKSELPVEELNRRLLEQRILAGVPLGWWYPELRDSLLVCVTETKTRSQIDHLTKALEELNCPVK